VQAVLGHASIETTRGYARSYDGTVATDYARAMLSVEQDLQLVPAETSRIDALIDALKLAGPLNDRQIDLIEQQFSSQPVSEDLTVIPDHRITRHSREHP
jgi:hypothetical protein